MVHVSRVMCRVLVCTWIVTLAAGQGHGAVIAQWNLNEGSGSTLSPQVGSISGTLTTSSVTWQSGGPPATNVNGVNVLSPYALQFPGATVNDYVDFGTSTTLAPSSLTVAFWAKDIPGAAAASQILLARYNSVPGSFEFGFAGNYLNFRIWPQTGSEIRVGYIGALNPFMLNEFEDNNWHLIVGTYNSSTGVGSLYVDTVLIDSRTVASPPQAMAAPLNVPLNLGRRAYPGAQEPYKGLIGGPLLIYDNALTLDQIRALTIVPEPSTLVSVGLGALAIVALRCCRRKRVPS